MHGGIMLMGKQAHAKGYLTQRVVHAHLKRSLKVLGSGWNDALGSNSYRDVVKEGLGQLLLHWRHICFHLHQIQLVRTICLLQASTRTKSRTILLWMLIADMKLCGKLNEQPLASVIFLTCSCLPDINGDDSFLAFS